MRCKDDFITNSSSTAYMVKNLSKTDNLTAKSFIDSIWPHIQNEMKRHGYKYTKEELVKSLKEDYEYFPIKPEEESIMSWGDNDDTIAGLVFDYVLREGIITGLVQVKFEEHLR